jgi:hypothetical protein
MFPPTLWTLTIPHSRSSSYLHINVDKRSISPPTVHLLSIKHITVYLMFPPTLWTLKIPHSRSSSYLRINVEQTLKSHKPHLKKKLQKEARKDWKTGASQEEKEDKEEEAEENEEE